MRRQRQLGVPGQRSLNAIIFVIDVAAVTFVLASLRHA